MKSLAILALLACILFCANAEDHPSFGVNSSVLDEVISVGWKDDIIDDINKTEKTGDPEFNAEYEVRSHCRV